MPSHFRIALCLLLSHASVALAQLNSRGNNEGTGEYAVRPLRQPTAIAWEARSGFRDFGAMAFSKGVIVTGNITGDGGIFAYDATSGKLLWGTRGQAMRSAPAIDGDFAYVITRGDGAKFRLTSLALTTGKARWSVSEEQLGVHDAPPIVSGGRVYVINESGKVKAFEAATGKPVWETPYSPEKGHCPTAMALAEGVLYFGGGHVPSARSQGRFVWALDAATGQVLWKYKAKPETYNDDGECITAPAVSGGSLVFGSESVLFALDAKTGALRWRKETVRTVDGNQRHERLSEPLITGGVIYTQSGHGLSGWDLRTGNRVFDLPGKFYDSPATNRMVAAGGILYYVADNETDVHWPIYALDTKTQRILWRHRSNRANRFESVATWRTSHILLMDDALIYENEGMLVKLR